MRPTTPFRRKASPRRVKFRRVKEGKSNEAARTTVGFGFKKAKTAAKKKTKRVILGRMAKKKK